MRAVFISFNQAFYDDVIAILDSLFIKGYTAWETVQGRGSDKGEPHLGTHVWPTLNSAIMIFVDEQQGNMLIKKIEELDESSPKQGIRAFWWNINGVTK